MNPKWRIAKGPKKRWPFDAAVTIALAALLLSGVQLLVTAPLFSALLVSPKLVVSGSGSRSKDAGSMGVWVVRNDGNGAANKIEIGFTAPAKTRFSFLPNLVTKISDDEGTPIAKNVKIEIDRLFPREEILIVATPGEVPSDDAAVKFPVISYVRSADGHGLIEQDRR